MALRSLTLYPTPAADPGDPVVYGDVFVVVARTTDWGTYPEETGNTVGWVGKVGLHNALYLRFAAPDLLYDVDVVSAQLEVESFADSYCDSPDGLGHFRVGQLAPDGLWETGDGFDFVNYPLSSTYPHPTPHLSDVIDRPAKLVGGDFVGTVTYAAGEFITGQRQTLGTAADSPDHVFADEPVDPIHERLQSYFEPFRPAGPPALPYTGPVSRPAGTTEEQERCGYVLDPYQVELGYQDNVSLYAADDPVSPGTALLLTIEDHYATWTSAAPDSRGRLFVEYTYQATGTTTDGGAITWELDDAPAGATITAGGLVAWTPTEPGVYTFTVGARTTDRHSVPLSWTVSVSAAGAPELTADVQNPVDGAVSFDDPVLAEASISEPLFTTVTASDPFTAAIALDAPVAAVVEISEPFDASAGITSPVAGIVSVSDSVTCAAGLTEPLRGFVGVSDPVETAVDLEVSVEGTVEP